MTTLSTSPRCDDGQKLGFDQLFACRTNAGTAKSALHKAKFAKPLLHHHCQECSIVLVDTKQPVPFFIRKVFARKHCSPFFHSLLQRIDQSHANGCREKRVAQCPVQNAPIGRSRDRGWSLTYRRLRGPAGGGTHEIASI